MTPDPFDFRRPPPSDLESRVSQWLAEACQLVPRLWPKLLAFPASLGVERVASESAAAGLEAFPAGAVAFRVKVEKFPDYAPLFALSRPLLLALVNGSLGVGATALPPDRELSMVERSLCNFLVRQLFLDPLTEAWPASERPRFDVAGRGEPKGICTLPPNDLAMTVVLMLRGPFGDHPVHLILPRTAPLLELVRPASDPVAVRGEREQIEALVKEMPVDVTVPLGTAEITMLQLALLQAGDVLVLEQKVTEPLKAKVAGKDKFAVWPGAVGRRQAVQVDTLVEA